MDGIELYSYLSSAILSIAIVGITWFLAYRLRNRLALRRHKFAPRLRFYILSSRILEGRVADFLKVVFGLSFFVGLYFLEQQYDFHLPVMVALDLFAIVFSIILIDWVKQTLSVIVFKAPLQEYADNTRERHAVSKLFGAKLLSEFLNGYFASRLFDSQPNLSSFLSHIEDCKGAKLPIECYATVLTTSARLNPRRVLAVWDFEAVPITNILDKTGNFKDSLMSIYFEVLTDLYSGITDPANKPRALLFLSEEHKQEQMTYPGWEKLERYFSIWGIKYLYYVKEKNKLDSLRSSVGFPFEDFVMFSIGNEKRKDRTWIVGYDNDDKRIQIGLRQDVEHAATVWSNIVTLSMDEPEWVIRSRRN